MTYTYRSRVSAEKILGMLPFSLLSASLSVLQSRTPPVTHTHNDSHHSRHTRLSLTGESEVIDHPVSPTTETHTYSSCVSADSHIGMVPVMAFKCSWSSLMHTCHTHATRHS